MSARPVPAPADTSPLTPEREQEIRETHPGEWYDGPWTQEYVDSEGGDPAYCRVVHHKSGEVLATLPDFAGPIALFIADAHDAVPELLGELDRLRTDVENLRLETAGLRSQLALHASWREDDSKEIDRLRAELAARPATAATSSVEFGIRYAGHVGHVGTDGDYLQANVHRYRSWYPNAAVVTRTVAHGPWTEVTS